MKRIAPFVLLLNLCAPVFAQEVPFNTRPPAELPPLIASPADLAPPAQAPEAVAEERVETTLDLREDLIALLPDETNRTECRQASIWQAAGQLSGEVSEEQMAVIRSCAEKIQARLDALGRILNALGIDDVSDPARLWPRPATARRDLAAAAIVLDVEQDCAAFDSWTADRAGKCAALLRNKALDVLQTLQRDQRTVDLSVDAPEPRAAVDEAPPSTAAAPAALPRSWESVVINALADQMVVQLRGVAAQKLLGVFGDALCKTHDRVDVASYFPETCALLVPGDPTTNVRLQITQLPAEFQRTLRNDLVALLPAVLRMTDQGDRVAFYLVTLYNALRNGNAPLDTLAAFQCPAPPPSASPDDARICSIVTFAARMARHHADHPDAAAWLHAVKADPQFMQWITEFGIDRTKAEEELTSLRTALTRALTAYDNAANQDALTKARFGIAVTDAILAVAVRLSSRDEASQFQRMAGYLAATQRLNAALTRWGSVGRAVVRVAEDFRRGYDPLTLSERAATQTECIAESDVGCVVKIAGIAITAFRQVAARHESELADSQIDAMRLAETIAAELATEIQGNTALQTSPLREVWQNRVANQVSALAMQAAPPLIDIHRGVLESRRLAALTDITPAARDEALAAAYTNMVESTFDVWRITTGLAVPADDRERMQRLVTNARTCWMAAKERNYLTLAGTMYSLSLDLGIGKPLPQRAEQYRLLLTNLAAAGDEQAFKTAVDTYLSQSASSIKKFDHPASITLTGLPGLAFSQLQDAGTNGSLFAPVGVDFFVRDRIPLPFTDARLPLSLGVFVSLLDLGNLVATKYEDDEGTADVEQSTRFRDVFAPGAYIRFPLRQSGFSLGAGWSRVPIVTEGSDERDYASKISAFVAYDLSWFTFWRRD